MAVHTLQVAYISLQDVNPEAHNLIRQIDNIEYLKDTDVKDRSIIRDNDIVIFTYKHHRKILKSKY